MTNIYRDCDSDIDELAFYQDQFASYYEEEDFEKEPKEEKKKRGRHRIEERWLRPCHVDEY